jgi:HEAT repeat protein
MSITPESVQILINSDDFGDRIRGINQLRFLDLNIAFTLLKPLLTDENVRVRYAAVSQLDTIGQADLNQSLALLRDRLYNEPEIDVQAAAADALGGLKLVEAYPDLEKSYQETSEWLLQFSIIAALGELGDSRAFDLLTEATKSGTSLVQTAAISALGELGDTRAIPVLTPFADSEDWQVRHRVAQAFGNLTGDEVRATLEKLAQDDFEQVATEAKYHLHG